MAIKFVKKQNLSILVHQGKYLIIASFFLGALLFWLAGCNTSDPVKGILDNAIGRLEQQSADWRTVVEETRVDLIKAGQSTLANEVQNAMTAAIGDAEAGTFCVGDYFRNRLKEDLTRIRASYTGEKVTLIPYFCNANPPQIDMSLPPDRRSSIIIYGYNMDPENVRVILVNNNGQETDVTTNSSGVSNLADPSPYKLTLNLGGNGVALNSTSKLLRFQLTDTEAQTLNVIQPVTPIGVQVNVHVQDFGWMGWVDNPSTENNFVGVSTRNKQIEAIQIRLLDAPPGMMICYSAQLQDFGWRPEVCDGTVIGTTGVGKRLETLIVRLVNAPADVHVAYRAYIPNQWLGWQIDGGKAGTEGRGIPVTAFNVKIEGQ